MTVTEARKRFSIRDDEPIKKDGVTEMIKWSESWLNSRHLPFSDREGIEKDLEAFKVLLTIAE